MLRRPSGMWVVSFADGEIFEALPQQFSLVGSFRICLVQRRGREKGF